MIRLFINSILEQDWERMHNLSFILVIFYAAVLVAVLIDLHSGMERNKAYEAAETSYGLRRTLIKIKDYFSVLMLFTMADVASSIWFSVPVFTALGTIGMIFIESKSVLENKKGLKKEVSDLPETLLQLLRNRDWLEEIIKLLNEQKNIEENNRDEN
jgi:NADH:ubiquinone oxidoreductase subunit 3 (subunit A)